MSKKEESEYDEYPIVIVAGNPQKCVWPMMIRLENNNGIRLHACEPYVPTISRLKEMTERYLEEVSRERITVKTRDNKKLEVIEVVLEYIPACKR